MENIPTKEEIKDFLKSRRKEWPRDKVAKSIGVEKSSLDQCLSIRDMSDSMRYDIAKLVGLIPSLPQIENIIPDNILQLKVPHEDYSLWEKAALSEQQTVSDWLLNAGNKMAKTILEEQFNITQLPQSEEPLTVLEKYGAVAAGQPVTTQMEGEEVTVKGAWNPEIHKVIEIDGESGQPDFIDGDEWIIDITKKGFTAAKGKPAIFSDSQGCYLKIYNGIGKPFTSVNPSHPDVQPDETLTLVGYPVQKATL